MTINPVHLDIIRFVATYYTVTRPMIQVEFLPDSDKEGRIARRHLNKLHYDALLNKTQMQVVNPENGSSAPVYYPSRKGLEFLAVELRDDSWLSRCCSLPELATLATLGRGCANCI